MAYWDDDFEIADMNNQARWNASVAWGSGVDNDAPTTLTGAKAIRFVYPAGLGGGPFMDASDLPVGGGEHIFVRWGVKRSANFEDSGVSTKSVFLNSASPYQVGCLWHQAAPEGQYQFVNNGGTDEVLVQTINPLTFTNDVWYTTEIEIKANTPGLNDGIVRMWIDDALKLDKTDANLRTSTTEVFTSLEISAFWNDDGGPSHPLMFVDYDRIAVDTQRIFAPGGGGSTFFQTVAGSGSAAPSMSLRGGARGGCS